jgi:NAD(P)-dependent dehydrogenase (short-subunit alcohol dehydrogenase family)
MAPTLSDRSRRHVVSGLSAGLVAAISSPALAQQSNVSGATQMGSTSLKQDPVTEYPRPPFPRQEQEWPGLASKMTPRPDHGETSYKGSGRLAGRKALITGGDSGMGRAAAIAFAREGADVAFNYLAVEEPDAKEVVQLIEAEGRKAVPLPGDLRDEAFCNKLVADAVRELGGLDILVSNAARQHAQDSILDISTQQFDDTFKTNVSRCFAHQGRDASLKPGATIINTASINSYDLDKSLLGYASTKRRDHDFHQGLGQASRGPGHSRQRRGPRVNLDAAAIERRSKARQDTGIWSEDPNGSARSTGRACSYLCSSGLERGKLFDRPSVWRGWG